MDIDKINICFGCDKILDRKINYCNDACKRRYYYSEMTPEQKKEYIRKASIRSERARQKKLQSFKLLKDLTLEDIKKINDIREKK